MTKQLVKCVAKTHIVAECTTFIIIIHSNVQKNRKKCPPELGIDIWLISSQIGS